MLPRSGMHEAMGCPVSCRAAGSALGMGVRTEALNLVGMVIRIMSD